MSITASTATARRVDPGRVRQAERARWREEPGRHEGRVRPRPVHARGRLGARAPRAKRPMRFAARA
eukprot:9287679-Pyramimonas_sp.AAC.1